MRAVKRAAGAAALWFLTWLLMPLGAIVLYGVYVLTGCRSSRILKAATILADTFFLLLVIYVWRDYITDKGDTWLKE